MKVWLVGDSLTKGLCASTEARSFAKLAAGSAAKTWELDPVEDAKAGANLATMPTQDEIPKGLHLTVAELGTNDVGQGAELVDFTRRYAKYLADIKKGVLARGHPVPERLGNGVNGGVTPFNLAISSQCGAAGGRCSDLSGLYMGAGCQAKRVRQPGSGTPTTSTVGRRPCRHHQFHH